MLLPRFGSLLRQTKGSTGAGFEPATWGLCALRFKLVDKLAHDEDSVVTAEAEAWHTSGWLPPNGEDRGPFCGSSLQLSRFLGVRNGGHDGVRGPRVARRSSAISVAAAVMGAKGYAPVGAVLLAAMA
jgi:hypothetical protein